MIQLYQQRDFGEKINATFQYAVRHLRSLGLSLLYIAGPIAIVLGIVSGLQQSKLLNIIKTGDPTAFTATLMAGILTMFLSTLTGVMVSLTTYGHLKVYQQNQHDSISTAAVWAEVRSHLLPGLLFSLVGFMLIILGCFFFLLPGIYIGGVLSLGLVVLVFEDTMFGWTWNRCFQLIRDKWWSTFGLLIIVSLCAFILSLAFALPQGILAIFVKLKLLPVLPPVMVVITTMLSQIGQALLSSLPALAIGFQYFNLVERQEHTGLLDKIDSIGTAAPTRMQQDDEGDY